MADTPQENPDIKKYAKLLGTVDYDKEAAEQLAAAINEVVELRRRTGQLEQIINENDELKQFIWATADGEAHAIHTLDDDHLNNIMLHLIRGGRAISRAIRGEAMRRGLTIPASVPIDWDDNPTRRLRADREDII